MFLYINWLSFRKLNENTAVKMGELLEFNCYDDFQRISNG